MSEILITGMSGFVGQNLKQQFINSKFETSALSLRNSAWRNLIHGKEIAIIHLAGKAHDTSNTSSEDEYFKVNRDLTVELFDKFLETDIKDFFYFSSVKAVADTVSGVLDENALAQPLTPYGRSKFEAEQYLLSKSLPEGKRLFIIRPCMIHGPGNKGNLNLLYKVVEKGVPWPLASFDNQRSFLGIDNLCFLLEAMLKDKKVASGIYNFADDASISTNELIDIIGSTMDKKPKFLFINPSIIKNLVKIGDILPLPLNSERLKKLTESYVVSNQKIKNALQLTHLPLSTSEGLAITIKSFKIQSI